jgi:disulfide bond formation protein DsbB
MNQRILIMFIIALAMMLGSLYIENFGDPVTNLMHGIIFPTGKGYAPCTLCRYERICMYPMVVILLMHFWKKTKDVIIYLYPFAMIGL